MESCRTYAIQQDSALVGYRHMPDWICASDSLVMYGAIKITLISVMRYNC